MADVTRDQFGDLMKDLASFFGKPSERQIELLFLFFKGLDSDRIKDAVLYLCEHRSSEMKGFPRPGEIHEALQELALQKGAADTEPDESPWDTDRRFRSKCARCADIGMAIEDRTVGEYQHSVAVYCDCPAGIRKRTNHEAYFRRRRLLIRGRYVRE